MIWVFTVLKSGKPIHQFIHKGDLPSYEIFKQKLNDDSLLSPLFNTLFYQPLVKVLSEDTEKQPHAGFLYNECFFLCCGFPDA